MIEQMVVGMDKPCGEMSEHSEVQEKHELSRRNVRSLIFHLLYAMESFDYVISLAELVDNFNRGFELSINPTDEIYKTAQAVIHDREKLDELFKPHLINWRYERLGTCTKLVLRFAAWEIYNTEVPSSIIINEAVELAKCFSEKDAYKFINGVLDEVIKHKNTKA